MWNRSRRSLKSQSTSVRRIATPALKRKTKAFKFDSLPHRGRRRIRRQFSFTNFSNSHEIISFFIAPPTASARTRSRQCDDPISQRLWLLSSGCCAVRAAPLSRNLKAFALPFPEMQSSRGCLPFGRVSASSGAPFIPTSARSLRRAQNLPALATARERAPRFYGSLRAVNVLLALLRSTLTVLPPPMKRSLSISRGEIVAAVEKSTGKDELFHPSSRPQKLPVTSNEMFCRMPVHVFLVGPH